MFMEGFNNPHDPEKMLFLEEAFFRDIEEVYGKQSDTYSEKFFSKLFPGASQNTEKVAQMTS